MRYTKIENIDGYVERELEFVGPREAIWAYRGAVFSKAPLLIGRVEAQMQRVLEESMGRAHDVYPERVLLYFDGDADLILEGLRKQLVSNDGSLVHDYVSDMHAADLQDMFRRFDIAPAEPDIATEQHKPRFSLGAAVRYCGSLLTPSAA